MSTVATGGQALSAIVVCAAMGMLGQGVRAVVGLKNANAATTEPSPQTVFSLAYLGLSFLIGAVAGVLAGFTIGMDKFLGIDLSDQKLLLGIAAAGYVGADFIENAMSIVIRAPAPAPLLGGAGAGNEAAPVPRATVSTIEAQNLAGAIRDLGGKIEALTPPGGATPLFETKSIGGPVSGFAATTVVPRAAGLGRDDIARTLHMALPKVDTSIWVPALTAAFTKFDLSTARRIAAALGQFSEEAGHDFREIKENLNYTSAQRVCQVFHSHFASEAEATPYLHNPEKLANRVYARYGGNGDEASADGFRFRGRGLIQLTGRNEYAEFGRSIGMSAEQAADYCETAEGAAFSGCWYLSTRGCLDLADKWSLETITRLVNGRAMLGLDRRIAVSNAALAVLQNG